MAWVVERGTFLGLGGQRQGRRMLGKRGRQGCRPATRHRPRTLAGRTGASGRCLVLFCFLLIQMVTETSAGGELCPVTVSQGDLPKSGVS